MEAYRIFSAGLNDVIPKQSFDSTGQIAPPGKLPRVLATLWEDEGTLIFEVQAKGVSVVRREDNHMINGTYLLKVAGIPREHHDSVFESIETKHVVETGPLDYLTGVWIPYGCALDIANKEQITDLLYPLFVSNIGALLYHPVNQTRPIAIMELAECQRQEQNQMGRPGMDRMYNPDYQESGGCNCICCVGDLSYNFDSMRITLQVQAEDIMEEEGSG